MGFHMVQKGYEVVAFDRGEKPLNDIAGYGAETVNSIKSLIGVLATPLPGFLSHSEEGLWTIKTAKELGIPVQLLRKR